MIIPIFKSGYETDANNYRPISLLSCFNRIFEKLVFKIKAVIFYRCKKNYKWLQTRSLNGAILDIVNAIQSNMNAGKFSCGVFVELMKAFDTVDHCILLQKISSLLISGVN